jgi:pentatricopeptide repeat protein
MKVKCLLTFFIFVFLSCAVKHNFSPFLEIEKASELAKKRGLPLANPFEISENVRKEVSSNINQNQPQFLRVKEIFDFLCQNERVNFNFNLQENLTAQETYDKKKGNCISYTGLFVSIARKLNIPVYFAHLNNIVDFEEKDGSYIASSHIAAGFRDGERTLLIDFLRPQERENYQFYEKIDDLTAYCLFYNNVAVEYILEEKYEDAQQILDFLLSLKPSLNELLNNRGVLYLKKGEYEKALQIFDKMRLKKMGYQPALHNGLLTSKILKNKSYEQIFTEELQKYENNDPLLLYERSMELAKQGKIEEAINLIKKAISEKPQNAFLYASLSVLYLQSGDLVLARDFFKKAQDISPNLYILGDIVAEYPKIKR